MKSKDIFCIFLLLFLIYLVMKPNIEGLQGQLDRQANTPKTMGGLIPVKHSSH